MRRLLGVAAAIAATLGAPSLAAAAPRASDFGQSVPPFAGAARSGPVVTPVLRAPRSFDLLGVHWAAPVAVHVDVRSHSVRTGRWRAWTNADGADDAPDDLVVPFRGSAPAWTGRSDRYQLRLSAPGRGLRVHFVRAHAGRVHAVSPTARAAAAGQPPIIPRAQWAGNQCQPKGTPSYGSV